MSPNDRAAEAVRAYRRRTKHHVHSYAGSLGYMDKATQPVPFRTFVGTERAELPVLAERLAMACLSCPLSSRRPLSPVVEETDVPAPSRPVSSGA